MSSSLLAMGVFTLVGAITPGPVNVLALRHGAARSRLVSGAYVLGASASYAAVVWVMGQGAQWLLQTLPQLSTAAQWLCAAYLLWLAWRLANAPVGQAGAQQQAGSQRPLQALLQALLQGTAVQTLNPKAWLVALAGVGLFVLPHANAPWALLQFCAISLLACLVGSAAGRCWGSCFRAGCAPNAASACSTACWPCCWSPAWRPCWHDGWPP
ncbi:lysE type translocator family protein [Delftia acidovorans]|nr:lysE type translocator family protein [Delftia acidovorans]